VCQAAADAGYQTDILGLEGRDLGRLLERLEQDPPDLVFNLVESLCGDTRNELLVPALLDLYRVPYTGPAAIAIGLCLDKERSKQVLLQHGIPTPAYRVVRNSAELDDPADPLGLAGLDYPQFLKLVREDASIGIEASNRALDREALRGRARQLLAVHRQPVLCESYVEGREVNVTVLGNGREAATLPLHEIDFSTLPPDRPRVLTYSAKWDEGHVDYLGTVPVPMVDVAPDVAQAIRRTALDSFAALGLRDYGRVDLRVDAGGIAWVIDVNPNCDLSPDAGVARTARAVGLDYSQLVGCICELAWRRHVADHSAADTC
jgi:D-alanine-D-alanine ligase